MKWYFWVLIGVAVLLTVIAIIAAVNSGKKKAQSTEAEVIKSNPDTLATSKSMIYQSLSRITDTQVKAQSVLLKPCVCSDPNIKCADTPGLTQCIECCKGKGSTAASWGGVSASKTAIPCATCG